MLPRPRLLGPHAKEEEEDEEEEEEEEEECDNTPLKPGM